MLTLVWNLALASPSVVATSADEGPLKKRLNDDPADVVILYGGEQDGSMDTCGCPNNPRGSLARLVAYQHAAEALSAPVITVNAGNWLRDTIGDDNRLRSDARVANAHMVEAVQAADWSAVNVSFRDLPYLASVGQFPKGAVLANARGPGGPPPYVIAQAGDLDVAITGVTHWSKEYLQPPDFERLDPVQALESLLPELHEKADLVVVLGYALGKDAKAIAKLDIDVLVDADTHRNRYDPVVVGDTVWVRSAFETQRLGELRLRVSDGVITSAHDRAIGLDKRIPSPAPWKARARDARDDIAAAQRELFGAP
ncbi:MAG: hypothetical protein H6737_11690 [Alphaproteobacteria bacterium]|nr:hypothetical protein [Alphaproteobacteria bacterium]